MKKYVVLICGLNIRNQNRITMKEQRLALNVVRDKLQFQLVEDKGSYLITTHHEPAQVHELVLGALQEYRPDLKISGAAVVSLILVSEALAELVRCLELQYGHDFNVRDHGITIGKNIWRGGLALPLFPMELPGSKCIHHETTRAKIFGWKPGGVLVAKREGEDIHWGSVVNEPAWRLIRRQENVVVELTSRSAYILQKLVHLEG